MNNEQFKNIIDNKNIKLGLQAKTRKDKINDGQRGKDITTGRDGEIDRRDDAGKGAGFGIRGYGVNREAATEERQNSVYPDRRGGEGDLPGGVDNGLAPKKRSPRQRAVSIKKTLATA